MTLPDSSLCLLLYCRSYWCRNQRGQQEQGKQWAATATATDKGKRKLFQLLKRDCCAKGVCILTGMSSTTFTKRVKSLSEEMHTDKPHGNTVSLAHLRCCCDEPAICMLQHGDSTVGLKMTIQFHSRPSRCCVQQATDILRQADSTVGMNMIRHIR